MLKLTGKTASYLLREGNPPLPFSPAQMFLVLDPYFPQAESKSLAETVEGLADLGYRYFVVNNLGQFSLFRNLGQEIHLIAGPWLYMFNAWALSFLASLGAEGFISPLENNRQNLERTIDQKKMRPMVFVPVFAWPPLFRIRADLGAVYDFSSFSDNRGERFRLNCGPQRGSQSGSLVIPETPFSITDKISFLKEAGFRRFVIDLSGWPIKKTDYKDLMQATESGTPLPRVSRFNWKDGFYNESPSTS
jgi:putative protease